AGAGTLAAAAAAVALVAGLAWWQLADTGGGSGAGTTPSYQVLASAARRLAFEDGSVAELRGDSAVRTDVTAGERRVLLVRGEAHFTVTNDPLRPFIVSAGGAAVRAVGTAFNVRLEAERVEVLVTEGEVRVFDAGPVAAGGILAAPLVAAGQRAVLERDAAADAPPKVEVTAAAPAEIEQALAWQATRLVFDRTPLAEAVEAFNRHSAATSGVRLVLGDSTLRTRRLGGTFRAANVEGFVRLLERSVEVRAERRGDHIVLLPVR
ncbi:MAG: FecR family protein, partial [Opitutaceae bacterium]